MLIPPDIIFVAYYAKDFAHLRIFLLNFPSTTPDIMAAKAKQIKVFIRADIIDESETKYQTTLSQYRMPASYLDYF